MRAKPAAQRRAEETLNLAEAHPRATRLLALGALLWAGAACGPDDVASAAVGGGGGAEPVATALAVERAGAGIARDQSLTAADMAAPSVDYDLASGVASGRVRASWSLPSDPASASNAAPGAVTGINPGQGLRLELAPSGTLRLTPRPALRGRWQSWSPAATEWSLELRWSAVGREGAQAVVAEPTSPITLQANRASLRHGAGDEQWAANGPRGIEQGFVIAERPAASLARNGDRALAEADGPLVLEIEVSGLQPELGDAAGGRPGVVLRDAQGIAVLSYTDLSAWDADGRELAARMRVRAGAVELLIDDGKATYPLRIDPLVWSQEQSLLPPPGDSDGGQMGASVALDGDVAIVGAPQSAIAADQGGAAYVYQRSASSWSAGTVLTASDPIDFQSFGRAVALDGDAAVVTGGPGLDGYAAYIFIRDGASWGPHEQARLGTAPAFGRAAAVSGTSALFGSPTESNPNPDQGAAYVHVRSASAWTEQQKLSASDGAFNDQFGMAAAIDGDSALVGATGDDNRGSAYVFVRTAASWGQQAKLTASDGAVNDQFGAAVSLRGDSALVGAIGDDVGGQIDQGAAYVFVRNAASWVEQAKLTASDGAASDQLGASVSLGAEVALVGAANSSAGSGATYTFTRSASVWAQDSKITPLVPMAGDLFGSAVSLSANVALIGTPGHPVPHGNSGAAYVFRAYGLTCVDASTCASGHCSDGFCCDTACGGQCESCRAADRDPADDPLDGICGPVMWGTDPGDECAGGGDPTEACAGAGACKKIDGEACGGPAACLSMHCLDGLCCDTPCTGLCQACSAAKTGGEDGSCAPVSAGTDPDDECAGAHDDGNACDGQGGCRKSNGTGCALPTECASGMCVNGVCCNAACTETCRACIQAWTGQPDGICAPANCAPYKCDGNGCGTSCATNDDCEPPAACDGQHCVLEASCDGDHTLLTGMADGGTTDCTPYRCSNEGMPSCLTSCASGADCVVGYSCSADGHCLPAAHLGDAGDVGGCGCRLAAPARPTGGLAPEALAAALLVLGSRRRRRARRPSSGGS
jgi:hypothetical protein